MKFLKSLFRFGRGECMLSRVQEREKDEDKLVREEMM